MSTIRSVVVVLLLTKLVVNYVYLTLLYFNSFSPKTYLIFHTQKAPSPSGVATTKVRECWAFE